MIDIAAIWAATKTTVDATKKGLELARKAENQDLIEHAQSMRDQVLDLKENISELREYISDLEERVKFDEELIWNDNCWEYEKEGKKHYVCPGCKADHKISHMSLSLNMAGGDFVRCQKCQTSICIQRKEGQRAITSDRGWQDF